MKQILCAAMIMLFGGKAFAQQMDISKDTTKIEKQYQADMDKATGGIEYTLVTSNAITAYDKLLNKYYNAALSKLTAANKKYLIEAQKAWLVWRDKEIKLISIKYSGMGDLNTASAAEEQLQILKTRVFQLYNYFDPFQ